MILFKAYIWIILYRCSCKPVYYGEWDTYQLLFKYSKVDNIFIIFIMNGPLYSDTIKSPYLSIYKSSSSVREYSSSRERISDWVFVFIDLEPPMIFKRVSGRKEEFSPSAFSEIQYLWIFMYQ